MVRWFVDLRAQSAMLCTGNKYLGKHNQFAVVCWNYGSLEHTPHLQRNPVEFTCVVCSCFAWMRFLRKFWLNRRCQKYGCALKKKMQLFAYLRRATVRKMISHLEQSLWKEQLQPNRAPRSIITALGNMWGDKGTYPTANIWKDVSFMMPHPYASSLMPSPWCLIPDASMIDVP